MRFDPRFLEQIKDRLPVSRIVGRALDLKRAGREWRALSPFNKEKTPSFFVNDQKQAWFDFSSGKSGDIFTWLIEHDGLTFPEAVERLAEEAGIPMPVESPQERERRVVQAQITDWLEEAQDYFHSQLLSPRGLEARSYLTEQRALPASEWAKYEIGYAPEGWSNLMDHLIGRGAKVDELKEAGLIATGRDGSRHFDYFRHRVTFAIRDGRGRLIGFGARALKSDEPAKYINSPDTPLFHKGHALYRYGEARAAMQARRGEDKVDGLTVVEGYFDAIALARAGLGYAVAPLGTALTEEQLAMLWRAGPVATLSFDGDKAGRRAAFRALERALPLLGEEKALRFCFLPDGQDPDDVLRGRGPHALGEAMARTTGVADVLWQREEALHNTATPEGRAAMKRGLFKALDTLTDKALAEQYRYELLERFDETYGFRSRQRRGRDSKGDWRSAKAHAGRPAAPAYHVAPPDPRAESDRLNAINMMSLAIHHPGILDDCVEEMAALTLTDHVAEQVRQALVRLALSGLTIDKSQLARQFSTLGLSDTVATLIHRATIKLPADAPCEDALRAWHAEARAYIARRDRHTVLDNAKRVALEGILAGNRAQMRAALTNQGPVTIDQTDELNSSDEEADRAAMETARALADAAITRKKQSRNKRS